MANIVIIGFGNIGKRHFEACLKSNNIKKIYIIEKNKAQFKNYKFENKNKNIILINNIQKLEEKIFLTIISTDSINRYSITINFLKKNITKYILFEKFLFNKNYHFSYMNKLLKRKKVNAYVNCNRRLSRDYINIKNKYGDQIERVLVEGNGWNFMSNSIHFIDLFIFLTNSSDITLNDYFFEKEISSKRKKYTEIHAKMSFMSNNKELTLIDISKPLTNKLTIYCKKIIIEIIEYEKIINFCDLNKKVKKTVFMKEPIYVSNTTNIALNNINKYKKPKLVDFSSSIKHHQIFLKALNKMLKKTPLNNNFIIT